MYLLNRKKITINYNFVSPIFLVKHYYFLMVLSRECIFLNKYFNAKLSRSIESEFWFVFFWILSLSFWERDKLINYVCSILKVKLFFFFLSQSRLYSMFSLYLFIIIEMQITVFTLFVYDQLFASNEVYIEFSNRIYYKYLKKNWVHDMHYAKLN